LCGHCYTNIEQSETTPLNLFLDATRIGNVGQEKKVDQKDMKREYGAIETETRNGHPAFQGWDSLRWAAARFLRAA
jgi:hypothetical protein